MGGSEFGVVRGEGLRDILIANRKAALQEAYERSQRLSAILRRSSVFEKTFSRALTRNNGYVGVPKGILLGLPEEYHDPYAVIESPAEAQDTPPHRSITPEYDLDP